MVVFIVPYTGQGFECVRVFSRMMILVFLKEHQILVWT